MKIALLQRKINYLGIRRSYLNWRNSEITRLKTNLEQWIKQVVQEETQTELTEKMNLDSAVAKEIILGIFKLFEKSMLDLALPDTATQIFRLEEIEVQLLLQERNNKTS